MKLKQYGTNSVIYKRTKNLYPQPIYMNYITSGWCYGLIFPVVLMVLKINQWVFMAYSLASLVSYLAYKLIIRPMLLNGKLPLKSNKMANESRILRVSALMYGGIFCLIQYLVISAIWEIKWVERFFYKHPQIPEVALFAYRPSGSYGLKFVLLTTAFILFFVGNFFLITCVEPKKKKSKVSGPRIYQAYDLSKLAATKPQAEKRPKTSGPRIYEAYDMSRVTATKPQTIESNSFLNYGRDEESLIYSVIGKPSEESKFSKAKEIKLKKTARGRR